MVLGRRVCRYATVGVVLRRKGEIRSVTQNSPPAGGPMRDRILPVLLLFLVYTSIPAPGAATAQEIRGTVMDLTSEEPLADVVLSVLRADHAPTVFTLSDSVGAFVLRGFGTDSMRVRVEGLGYAPTESVVLALAPSDTLRLEIRLRRRPVELPGVVGTGNSRLNRNREGFLKRQRNGFGRYLGSEEIAQIRPTSVLQLLGRLDGVRFVPGSVSGAVKARTIGSQGRPTLCDPRIYVDGVQIRDIVPPRPGQIGGVAVDQNVRAMTIRAVEVYRNPSQAPSEFQTTFMDACPVVVIWTDFGLGLVRSR